MTWTLALEALGWLGSGVLVWSLLQSRILRLRLINTVGCLVLIVYNGLVGVWPMVGLNVALCLVNLVHLIRLTRERHDRRAFAVVEVGGEDAYLRHVLAQNAGDIERFQPRATWAPAEERDHAFLVLHGNETVGVVLVDADGDTARVRLDYVLPKYRDFTPGEFLYTDSGFLTDRGFSRVTSPPLMRGAYYDRVGFQPRGDHYVLEL